MGPGGLGCLLRRAMPGGRSSSSESAVAVPTRIGPRMAIILVAVSHIGVLVLVHIILAPRGRRIVLSYRIIGHRRRVRRRPG